MTKKKLFVKILVIVIILISMFFGIFGKPLVLINNHRLNKAFTSIDTATIDLNEVVPFQWDAVYTFDPYTPKEEIIKIIGIKDRQIKETVSEAMLQVIFLKGSHVVSNIWGYPDTLGYDIYFSTEETGYAKIEYSNNAVFDVEHRPDFLRLSYSK